MDHKGRVGCHHCRRMETPQWRLGPNGAKTLCNAPNTQQLTDTRNWHTVQQYNPGFVCGVVGARKDPYPVAPPAKPVRIETKRVTPQPPPVSVSGGRVGLTLPAILGQKCNFYWVTFFLFDWRLLLLK